MNRLILLVGLCAIVLGQSVDAQSVLSTVSHSGSASASTTSAHYVYTLGGSPRTGRYWYWALRTNQTTSSSALAPLNGSTGIQQSTGSFYAPLYSATSSAGNTLSNTSAQAVYSAQLNVQTILSTPPIAHQLVAVSTQTEDIFTFTLARASDVRLKIVMPNGGHLVFTDMALGDSTFSTSGSMTFQDILPAGTYQIAAYLYLNATRNTQTGVYTLPGTTAAAMSYTLTATPSSGAGAGGGGGVGD